MAFGDLGIIDDFNRSDSGDLGADWSTFWGDPSHAIASNQMYASGAWKGNYRNTSTFGPDCEAYITQAVTAQTWYMFLRVDTPATPNGYRLWRMNGYGRLYRIDAGVGTQLGAEFSLPSGDGYRVGIEMIGEDLKAYVDDGGGWDEAASRSDSTYDLAGYLALESAAAGSWDDFGGGTLGGAGGADFWLW